MIEFYDGTTEIQVNSLDYLNNLSQEELNTIAVGPQDRFFEKLEFMNQQFERNGMNHIIDVTNKWNWKPGSYDKMKELIYKKLEIAKKCQSMDKLFNRTMERNNYLSFISRQAREMELERANLKRLGVSKDVDINVFQTKCIEFVEIIQKQCELVDIMTEGNIKLTPYIHLTPQERNPFYYLDVVIKNMTLSVFNGEKEIQKFPLDPIHIIINMSFRNLLNNRGLSNGSANLNFRGKYLSDYSFPYIQNRTRYSSDGIYSVVCLDQYNDDVSKALSNNDYQSFAMLLMQWCQYYNTTFSHPYNYPHLLHYGMPDNMSKEYYNHFDHSNIKDACSSTLERMSNKENITKYHLDVLTFENEKCNQINCQFINDCRHNIRVNNSLNNWEKYHDWAEGITGIILEYVEDCEFSIHSKNLIIEKICGSWIDTNHEDEIENYNILFVQHLIRYICDSINKSNFSYVRDWLIERDFYIETDVEKEDSKRMSEESIKEAMKHWASQEGA
jgi:hypothetical protein